MAIVTDLLLGSCVFAFVTGRDRRREFAHLSYAAEHIIASVIDRTRDVSGSAIEARLMRAGQCRAQAAEYAQLALQLRDSNLRKSYQELARHWRQAAERFEQPIKLAVLKEGRA